MTTFTCTRDFVVIDATCRRKANDRVAAVAEVGGRNMVVNFPCCEHTVVTGGAGRCYLVVIQLGAASEADSTGAMAGLTQPGRWQMVDGLVFSITPIVTGGTGASNLCVNGVETALYAPGDTGSRVAIVALFFGGYMSRRFALRKDVIVTAITQPQYLAVINAQYGNPGLGAMTILA